MENKRISPANIFAKNCIVTALLQLIYTKPLSAITISNLCDKAGVSRMTFYRNYTSIEEILRSRLAEIFAEYKNNSNYKSGDGIYYDQQHMVHYFTSLSEYREFFDGLMYCGFGSQFLEMLDDYIIEEWEHISNKFTLTAFSGSLYNLFRLWSSNEYSESASELAQKLSTIYKDSELIE